MTKQRQTKATREDKRVPDPSVGLIKAGQAIESKRADSTHPVAAKSNSKRKQTSAKSRSTSDATSSSNATSVRSPGPLAAANSRPTVCSSLEDFSSRAREIKGDIRSALEGQKVGADDGQSELQPYNQIRGEILKISGLDEKDLMALDPDAADKSNNSDVDSQSKVSNSKELAPRDVEEETTKVSNSDVKLERALDQMVIDDKLAKKDAPGRCEGDSGTSSVRHAVTDCIKRSLSTKSDAASRYVAQIASLQSHFKDAPHLLEPICKELVELNETNIHLEESYNQVSAENQKLILVNKKLENLCRELQKSNNSIRIESLDLIKAEQSKAKEQTAKIQSTLAGVIKLFDENQHRNLSLRQENIDLQQKLKSLLDHCDNWEKSVETTLRQRDLENRLVKTELAKANLIKNEECEKFLKEKKELLQLLSLMQEQQQKIQGQEAKLRSDLSNYASKYNECQQAISQGMSKFQVESKRMLQQIERSKQDYKSLLAKYEACTKRLTSLLEEKKEWTRSMNTANKKVETLEKLCRALQAKQTSASDRTSGPSALLANDSSSANLDDVSDRGNE